MKNQGFYSSSACKKPKMWYSIEKSKKGSSSNLQLWVLGLYLKFPVIEISNLE
jgi:hypothetical protein